MLKANLVHVQTLRASVGSSIEVFTFGKRPKPTAPADAAPPPQKGSRPGGKAISPHSTHKTQHNRPQPYPSADKVTRGRAPRRRVTVANSKGDAPDSPSPEPAVPLRRSNTSSSVPPPDHQPPTMMQVMRGELDATHADLSRSKHEVSRYAERCRYLERALRDASDRLMHREREIEELKRERSRLLAERERDRAHTQRLERSQTVAVHRRPAPSPASSRTAYDSDGETVLVLDDASARRRNRSVPPAQRSRSAHPLPLPPKSVELLPIRGLEVFLSKTDRWSGAQVIEAVQDLNSEIIQLAAAVVEVTTVAPAPVATAQRVAHAKKSITARLGPAFAQVLAGRDHSHDPTLVQLALQTCLATCTTRLLSVFCIGLPMMPNELFAQLYEDVREQEPQATSSRWRALTLQHIRNLNPQLEEGAANEFVTQILRAWTEIFVLCACTSVEGVALHSMDALRARFGRQCMRIAIRACKLARVINEEIMSTNFELLFVENGTRFKPEQMVNAYANAAAPVGPVLCTTELGLQCVTRTRLKPGADVDETVARTLLLPKVVLETVPQVLDNMSSA